MKYIKTYEKLNDIEYILCRYNFDDKYAYHVKLTPELIEFINNTVGIIESESYDPNIWINVKYENIPDIIKYNFHADGSIMLTKDVIIAKSKDKKEIEAILAGNNYNL